MTDPHVMKEEADRISQQAEQCSPEEAAALLNEAMQLQPGYEAWRSAVRTLVEKALLAGVEPADLYDKPYSPGYVRMIYADLRKAGADLPPLRSGPKARRPRT